MHRHEPLKATAAGEGAFARRFAVRDRLRGPSKDGTGRRHAALRCCFETLEDRLALAAAQGVTLSDLPAQSAVSAEVSVGATLSTVVNSSSAAPTGFTPAQIRAAYGLGALSTDATGGAFDGTGQTIAIVDAYDDPNIFQDLDAFDQQFGTASAASTLYQQYGAATSFLTVLNQSGNAGPLPTVDPAGPGNPRGTWEQEESLDVQWAHSIAPGAKIDLIEANSATWPDLSAGVLAASQLAGVSVVSMSWGLQEASDLTPSQQQTFDAELSGFTGVSYVAATGDQGGPGLYPATSPDVLAVGGTALSINLNGSYKSETAWNDSNGGFSQVESKPAYQDVVLSPGETQRLAPDVAFDASTATAVATYDSYDNPTNAPWSGEGGTSLGSPVWAGLIALADQGRVAAGSSLLDTDSSTQALSAIYSLPQQDFHDVTSGSNKSYSAEPGFDQVTGLGTPVANLLVPDLVNYGGPIALTPGTLPAGTPGVAYHQTIAASGGVGPKDMTSNVTAGTLPSGLSFESSGSQFDIVGTPLTSGTVDFDLTATDSNGDSSTQSYVLVVVGVSAPAVTGVSPTAAQVGALVTITGSNLLNATAVDFGSVQASILSDAQNQIVVLAPHVAGTVDVTVTTAGGTSALSAADQFSGPTAVSTVAIGQAPPAISNQNSATFTFSSPGDASTPANKMVYEVSLDGGAFAVAFNSIGYSGLADGSHTFQVQAVDLEDQVSAPVSYTWLVDTTPPTSQVQPLPARTATYRFSGQLVGQRRDGRFGHSVLLDLCIRRWRDLSALAHHHAHERRIIPLKSAIPTSSIPPPPTTPATSSRHIRRPTRRSSPRSLRGRIPPIRWMSMAAARSRPTTPWS